MSKKAIISAISTSVVLGLIAIAITQCYFPIKSIYKKSFVPMIVFIEPRLVVQYGEFNKERADSTVFFCKTANGKLENVDHLGFGHHGAFAGQKRHIEAFGDDHYNRHIPVMGPDVGKYYDPCYPCYADILEVKITSPNASFGEDFPPGSDLTPICTFYYRSLEEYIRNDYQGDYITVHKIRANDKAAWKNLKLFENCYQNFQFDCLPQVQGEGDAQLIFSFTVVDNALNPQKELLAEAKIRIKML